MSIRFAILFLTLFCSPIISDDVGVTEWFDQVAKATIYYYNRYNVSITSDVIFFNEQSLLNDTVAYASCNNYQNDKVLDCTLHIVVRMSETKNKDVKCETKYYFEKGKIVDRILLLRPLRNDRVLFKWLMTDEKDAEKEPFVIIRVMNMVDCTYKDSRIAVGEKPYFHRPTLVFYNDTYDVFFRNKDECGDFMCSQTYDYDGKLINGLVPSYLLAEDFQKPTFVCPVFQGHFLISNKIQLFSSISGKFIELVEFIPSTITSFAYSCDHGFLGVCWQDTAHQRSVFCLQFDSQGRNLMKTSVDFTYVLRTTMSVRNLQDGNLLLQTTWCKNNVLCEENPEQWAFMVNKFDNDGKSSGLFGTGKIKNECSSSLETTINELPNKDVCMTIGCLGDTETSQTSVGMRAIFYCQAKRYIEAQYKVPLSPTENPFVEEVTKKSSKPKKPKKGPIWGH